MSVGYAIEYITEYKISRAELRKLSDDAAATFAILSYAVSEINALSRIYVFSSHETIGKEVVDYAILIQRFVLLRNWYAKLFEFVEFLEIGIGGRGSIEDDINKFAQEALDGFSALRNSEGYNLVRNVRHEATNHYSLKAAKKNLAHVSENANCSMYLHEMNGNSFYPLGEEVMFVGRMNRHGASLASKAERAELLNLWMSWNLEATKWLARVHLEFFVKIVKPAFPDKYARRQNFWIPCELAKTPDSNLVPIFLRVSDQ